MNKKLSNRYYLQAVEAYPFDLTEAIESLEYALSCDSNHAGAHCLLGMLYAEYLKQFEKGRISF